MIKKKLSRIEDFISPTCFSYLANTFRYSYKFPFTPTLYKTKHDNSFYFLYFILRTKFVALPRWCIAKACIAEGDAYKAPLCKQARVCSANQSFALYASARQSSAFTSLRESLLRKPKRSFVMPRLRTKLRFGLRSKLSLASPKAMHCEVSKREFAPQTKAKLCDASLAVRTKQSFGLLRKPKLCFVRISEANRSIRCSASESLLRKPKRSFVSTCEGSLSTFRKIRPQKITTIFFDSTDTTSYIIIRPLINCSRKSITTTCRLSRLPVYPDLSNLKLRYSRNRIRKQIIPTLKFFLNPKIEKSLFKFSENLE